MDDQVVRFCEKGIPSTFVTNKEVLVRVLNTLILYLEFDGILGKRRRYLHKIRIKISANS